MRKYMCLLVVLVVASATSGQSQSFTAIGVLLISEGDRSTAPAFGVSMEHKATKHSGFETGVYYRGFKQEYRYAYPSGSGSEKSFVFDSVLTYLSVPVLYKFYSKVVNFEVGVTADFYLAGNRLVYSHQSNVNTAADQLIVPKARAGIMLKLSKSINLGKRLVVEPELRINPLLEPVEAYGPSSIFIGLEWESSINWA